MSPLLTYFPIAEAISLLFYPNAEIVIHDLQSGIIAAIYNNSSKRKAGDESLLEELKDLDDLPHIFPVYSKINWDGKKIKSISATLRDQNGKTIGLLCINVDLSKWEELHQFLGNWLYGTNEHPKPEILFKDDWRERINEYVSVYLKKESATLRQLSKEQKKALVLALYKEGAFNAKNAASYIADVLDLSRATIYNYLR